MIRYSLAWRAWRSTARKLPDLAQILRRGNSTLSPGERELIASYVSSLNECTFTTSSHSAFAAAQLEGGMPLVKQVHKDLDSAAIPDKLHALLRIAVAVQDSGRKVTAELVAPERAVGASDPEIHDTVLIAATLCMFARYVDGTGNLRA